MCDMGQNAGRRKSKRGCVVKKEDILNIPPQNIDAVLDNTFSDSSLREWFDNKSEEDKWLAYLYAVVAYEEAKKPYESRRKSQLINILRPGRN